MVTSSKLAGTQLNVAHFPGHQQALCRGFDLDPDEMTRILQTGRSGRLRWSDHDNFAAMNNYLAHGRPEQAPFGDGWLRSQDFGQRVTEQTEPNGDWVNRRRSASSSSRTSVHGGRRKLTL